MRLILICCLKVYSLISGCLLTLGSDSEARQARDEKARRHREHSLLSTFFH